MFFRRFRRRQQRLDQQIIAWAAWLRDSLKRDEERRGLGTLRHELAGGGGTWDVQRSGTSFASKDDPPPPPWQRPPMRKRRLRTVLPPDLTP